MNCQSNFIVSSFIFKMNIFQVKWTAARRPTQRFGTVHRKSLCSACYCWKWYGAGIPDGLRRRSGNRATIQPKHNFTPFKYVPILIYDTIHTQDGLQKVDLKVLLPTHEVVSVSVCKTSTTLDVYNATVEKICLDKESVQYFALFEIVEYNFGGFFISKITKVKKKSESF